MREIVCLGGERGGNFGGPTFLTQCYVFIYFYTLKLHLGVHKGMEWSNGNENE